MIGHTPGPWRHATKGNLGNCIEGPTGKRHYAGDDGYRAIAMVQACTPAQRTDEQDANAAANIALIAAAPDLLVALKAMLDAVDGVPCGPEDQARAAIAKAEGR